MGSSSDVLFDQSRSPISPFASGDLDSLGLLPEASPGDVSDGAHQHRSCEGVSGSGDPEVRAAFYRFQAEPEESDGHSHSSDQQGAVVECAGPGCGPLGHDAADLVQQILGAVTQEQYTVPPQRCAAPPLAVSVQHVALPETVAGFPHFPHQEHGGTMQPQPQPQHHQWQSRTEQPQPQPEEHLQQNLAQLSLLQIPPPQQQQWSQQQSETLMLPGGPPDTPPWRPLPAATEAAAAGARPAELLAAAYTRAAGVAAAGPPSLPEDILADWWAELAAVEHLAEGRAAWEYQRAENRSQQREKFHKDFQVWWTGPRVGLPMELLEELWPSSSHGGAAKVGRPASPRGSGSGSGGISGDGGGAPAAAAPAKQCPGLVFIGPTEPRIFASNQNMTSNAGRKDRFARKLHLGFRFLGQQQQRQQGGGPPHGCEAAASRSGSSNGGGAAPGRSLYIIDKYRYRACYRSLSVYKFMLAEYERDASETEIKQCMKGNVSLKGGKPADSEWVSGVFEEPSRGTYVQLRWRRWWPALYIVNAPKAQWGRAAAAARNRAAPAGLGMGLSSRKAPAMGSPDIRPEHQQQQQQQQQQQLQQQPLAMYTAGDWAAAAIKAGMAGSFPLQAFSTEQEQESAMGLMGADGRTAFELQQQQPDNMLGTSPVGPSQLTPQYQPPGTGVAGLAGIPDGLLAWQQQQEQLLLLLLLQQQQKQQPVYNPQWEGLAAPIGAAAAVQPAIDQQPTGTTTTMPTTAGFRGGSNGSGSGELRSSPAAGSNSTTAVMDVCQGTSGTALHVRKHGDDSQQPAKRAAMDPLLQLDAAQAVRGGHVAAAEEQEDAARTQELVRMARGRVQVVEEFLSWYLKAERHGMGGLDMLRGTIEKLGNARDMLTLRDHHEKGYGLLNIMLHAAVKAGAGRDPDGEAVGVAEDGGADGRSIRCSSESCSSRGGRSSSSTGQDIEKCVVRAFEVILERLEQAAPEACLPVEDARRKLVTQQDKDWLDTPGHTCARYNLLVVQRWLLERCDASMLLVPTKNGWLPLATACRAGNLEVAVAYLRRARELGLFEAAAGEQQPQMIDPKRVILADLTRVNKYYRENQGRSFLDKAIQKVWPNGDAPPVFGDLANAEALKVEVEQLLNQEMLKLKL